MIFKVQVPICGESLALVYNQDRPVMAQVPITKAIRKVCGERLKAYVHGEMRDSGNGPTLQFSKQAPWQEW